MLRHRLAALIGAMAVMSTAFLFGGAARAATYPPGTSVPPCSPGDASAGNVVVGQGIKFILCGDFADGATVTVSVNGTSVNVPKTPVNGSVTVDVKVISTTLLEVDDPVSVAITCGTTNTVTATGPTAAGGTASSNGTFVVLCGSTVSTTPTSSTTSTTTASTTTTTSGSATTTTTTKTGGLAFTGGNVLMAIIVALLLIALGALLVIVQRRRRQTL